ncbi:hypothetical protein Aca07nite_63480 [Actinoplanes capillaceus]|uniref:Uncharacterized protein n=1 Tax=Actinoplanes campanulatus TaxID=113559 RepID=A0ABQ3WS87_9ACTN|nr:hypothetical protein Aca07nite_63480 [Actinoplanes capillaceus]
MAGQAGRTGTLSGAAAHARRPPCFRFTRELSHPNRPHPALTPVTRGGADAHDPAAGVTLLVNYPRSGPARAHVAPPVGLGSCKNAGKRPRTALRARWLTRRGRRGWAAIN